MKIGKYIIEIVPNDSYNHELRGLPYNNHIWYNKHDIYHIIGGNLVRNYTKSCKHIKPNSGIRYSILGKYWIFLIIKQGN